MTAAHSNSSTTPSWRLSNLRGSGQNEGLVFIARAGNGNIGQGVYEGVYGGEEIDSGVLVFGMKGGC